MSTRLITIRFSHYCEKVRWALQRYAVPYVEEAHPPLYASLAAKRAGGTRTVPVLVTAERTFDDSTDILRWIDAGPGRGRLFPNDEVARWEARFDEALGPATRRIAYAHLLPSRDPAMRAVLTRDGNAFERWSAGLAAPLLRRAITRGLRIDDEGVARSEAKLVEVIAEVDGALADGRRYLCGNAFSAADLTFAALAAPLLMPPAYAALVGPLGGLPSGLRDRVDRLRATPAGRYGLRIFDQRAEVERS